MLLLQVVFRGRRKSELIPDEVLEDRSSVPADGSVSLVRDNQIKFGWSEQAAVFVIEQQGLNRCDHDVGLPPIISLLLVDDGSKVVLQIGFECLIGLNFKFEAINQKEYAFCIPCLQKQLDQSRGCKRLSCSCRHLKQKTCRPLSGIFLHTLDSALLIATQKAELVLFNESGTLGFALPTCLLLVSWHLRQDDIVEADLLIRQPMSIGLERVVISDIEWSRKPRDHRRVALL